MNRRLADWIALLLSLLAVILSYWVSERYFEGLAHLEDEQAYVWQAQVLAGGKLTVESPEPSRSFLWPFVVDYQGQRFGKYPPGWPALLAVGVRLNLRGLVNPLLAGLGIWLIYCLGRRTFGATVGLLASGLTLTSPFFLVNSGSLLSHPLGLVLSAGFSLAWLDAFGSKASLAEAGADSERSPARLWITTLLAALFLGMLVLTRPMTAAALALPFAIHGLYKFIRGDSDTRLRLLGFIGLAAFISLFHFAWQYALSGNAFLNPYTLWWEYDRVGFGPEHGRIPGGHTLRQGWINTKFSLIVGNWDQFGWPMISWLFLPIGLIAILRHRQQRVEALLLASVYPVLVLVYTAYWVGASLYGPRYYYEGFYSISLVSGAGLALLAGWPIRPGQEWVRYGGWKRWRPLAAAGLAFMLIGFNLLFYTPQRLQLMHGLYGVERSHLKPFLSPSAQELTPALIIVHPQKEWIEYGRLLELASPFMDKPFVFIYSQGRSIDERVARQFPDRTIYHYYADEPYKFYVVPRR